MNIAHRGPSRLFISFIIMVPLALFWRWLLKGEVLFWGTSLLQFWPWHQLVRLSLQSGEWPLWNPWLGNGAPLLANLQTAFFYPPNLLYLLLPVAQALTLSVILHLILAGLLMYAYTRYLGLSPFGATLSALTYMLSGYLIGRLQFVTMINAAAWFPLLLLLSDRIATRPGGMAMGASRIFERPHRFLKPVWSSRGGQSRSPLWGARGASMDIIWLALILAIQLLAGHAQLWFYGLWLIGPYALFRSWQSARKDRSVSPPQPVTNRETAARSPKSETRNLIGALVQTCWRLAAALGLAALLAAVQILPTAEFTAQSARSSGAEENFALTYSFWPWRLITLLAPDFFGNPAQGNYWGYANYWEDHAYLGILPWLLALGAVWNYYRPLIWGSLRQQAQPVGVKNPNSKLPHQVIPFFGILIPISLVLAMGWNTPVYLWVFEFVPGFGFFQAPARLLIWYTLAMAVLAGLGAESLILTPQSRRGWQRLLVIGLGLAIAGLAGGGMASGRSLTFLRATLNLGIWLALSMMLLLRQPAGNLANSARKIGWQWAMLILVALDLGWAAWSLNPTLPAAIFSQSIAAADFLKTQPQGYRFFVDETFDYTVKFDRYFRFESFGSTELADWQALKETLIPNLGIYAGLPSANNYDPLVVGRQRRLIDLLEEAAPGRPARLLSLMNVGYLIDAKSAVRLGPIIYQNESIIIQRLPEALPRAYFVQQAYRAQQEAEVIARLTSADFDPRREVIIMDSGGETLLAMTPASPETASRYTPAVIRDMQFNQVTLEVEAPAPGFVVLTDAFYPGWQATVDGQPAQILPANLAFRAVTVEAGFHQIIFQYYPATFTFGLWTSTAILLIIGVIIARSLTNNRRKRRAVLEHNPPFEGDLP